MITYKENSRFIRRFRDLQKIIIFKFKRQTKYETLNSQLNVEVSACARVIKLFFISSTCQLPFTHIHKFIYSISSLRATQQKCTCFPYAVFIHFSLFLSLSFCTAYLFNWFSCELLCFRCVCVCVAFNFSWNDEQTIAITHIWFKWFSLTHSTYSRKETSNCVCAALFSLR